MLLNLRNRKLFNHKSILYYFPQIKTKMEENNDALKIIYVWLTERNEMD